MALIALKLKEVFGLDDVNKLPIVYNIAWYEQKAVIVLLALLSLGVKNFTWDPHCLPSSARMLLMFLLKTFWHWHHLECRR